MSKKAIYLIFSLITIILLAILTACFSEPKIVEVTRIVEVTPISALQNVVEVTRVVEIGVTQIIENPVEIVTRVVVEEVEVEVTRVVTEIVVEEITVVPKNGEAANIVEEPDAASTPASKASPIEEPPPEEVYFPNALIEEGKYNVAFVYHGSHDDGGWTQAHDTGRQYIQNNLDNIHTAYIELVNEGVEAEQVTRYLAREGFDVIISTYFGFQHSSEIVAEEFPDVNIIQINGSKANQSNFGNLMGAMEDMKYLAGMLAGSRAKTDGNQKLGYIATFPVPEELRLGNAFALGAQKTCPNCIIEVRWVYTWNDPVLEKQAATSLFTSGAQVAMTGAGTTAPVEVTPDGRWGITYNYNENCTLDTCLTSMYWNWGPEYARIVENSRDGIWQGGRHYFDADTGALGLLGFMPGEEPRPGTIDLPTADISMIKDTLATMLTGEFTRFDVFKGPITDNQGNIILVEGKSLEQTDLEGFAQFGDSCNICMYWWNENVISDLPAVD